MATGVYNRLFTKILDSSIWLEPCTTRIVWVTLIAAMDEDGYAHFSAIENLAARARVSVKDTQKAIDCFLSPDPNSSNPENEGRRIERVPGGFFILNAPEHRKMLNREIQREQVRLRVARHREKQGGNKSTVTRPLQKVTPASASAVASESEKGISKGKPEGESEVIEFCAGVGLPEADGRYFWEHWQGNGFTNGGKTMKDWKATIRSWKAANHCPSQKGNNGTNQRPLTKGSSRTYGTANERRLGQYKDVGKV